MKFIKGQWYKFRPYTNQKDTWYMRYLDGNLIASEYISSYNGVVKYEPQQGNFSIDYYNQGDKCYSLADINEFIHLLPLEKRKEYNQEINYEIY